MASPLQPKTELETSKLKLKLAMAGFRGEGAPSVFLGMKFSLLLAEYRKAPDVTRRRLYLEAMQAILPNLQKKIIVDDSLKNILQTLPLLPTDQTRTSP